MRERAAIALAVAVALPWLAGCSSKTNGGGGADAGDEGNDLALCPATQPEAGSECTGNLSECPYQCDTTFCSCASTFWQCNVVTHGQGSACASVDGTPAPSEGASCVGSCGPYEGDTCDFTCGAQGRVSATCGMGGWHVVGVCSSGDGG